VPAGVKEKLPDIGASSGGSTCQAEDEKGDETRSVVAVKTVGSTSEQQVDLPNNAASGSHSTAAFGDSISSSAVLDPSTTSLRSSKRTSLHWGGTHPSPFSPSLDAFTAPRSPARPRPWGFGYRVGRKGHGRSHHPWSKRCSMMVQGLCRLNSSGLVMHLRMSLILIILSNSKLSKGSVANTVMWDIFQCINQLFTKARILHRDISHTNEHHG